LLREYWGAKYPQADLSRFDVSLVAVRDGRYKYIQDERGNGQLYDLESDPHEQSNLVETAPEQVARMKRLLVEYRPS
jgi:arylsulfatase A-like enzyme